ncbi:MAG: 50S ribosomal protein L23 [bacterium]|nr:50S ribosomal protein L23 [bacterium]
MNTKYLEIIKAPVVTEKSAALAENNTYSFYVDVKANKTEIKDAIEKIFKVTVEEVRTINVHPRKKRVGRYTGLTNRKKKAIVRLADGQSINLG